MKEQLSLPASGGLTLQNYPGWAQGFDSSGAVGGDVTDSLIWRENLFFRVQMLFPCPGSAHQRIYAFLLQATQGKGSWW